MRKGKLAHGAPVDLARRTRFAFAASALAAGWLLGPLGPSWTPSAMGWASVAWLALLAAFVMALPALHGLGAPRPARRRPTGTRRRAA